MFFDMISNPTQRPYFDPQFAERSATVVISCFEWAC